MLDALGHIAKIWSLACSVVLHSQSEIGSRPHLYINEWNRLTLIHSQLSLTDAVRGKPLIGLLLVMTMKLCCPDLLSMYSFVYDLFTGKRKYVVGQGCLVVSAQLTETGV